MSISISTSTFETNHHSAQRAGSNTHGFYVYHNVDVINEITINGRKFSAVYQAGNSYNYNDYSCPSNAILLSTDGGADQALVDIWNEGDFEAYSEDDLEDALQSLKENYDLDLTVDDLRAVYAAVVENQIQAELEVKSLDLSYDVEDYKEDEASGLLELKTVSDVAFGRLNENGYVCLFEKEEGEQLTRFEDRWPTIYVINSGFSAHYEHPEGLVISTEDARRLNISIED